MLTVINQRLNNLCALFERRLGLFGTGAVFALFIMGFGMLYITPHFKAGFHGLQYSLLSEAPFDFAQPNSLRNRILPSLIGYLTYLRGDLFVVVPLLFALVFITCIYWVYRKKNYGPVDALLFTGFIAFSCTLYIQLASPGYTDIVFYYFIFLAFAFINNSFYSALFYCFALLTHESSLFLFPGLLMYSYYINKYDKVRLLKYFFYLVMAIVPLLVYRYWVSLHAEVEYDLAYYFSKKNIQFSLEKVLPLLPAGAFYAFKLFWFFPIYILSKTWFQKERGFFLIIATILICNFAQLIIAFDITRMLCLGFPAIILAAEKLKEMWEPEKFTRFTLGLTLANFLIFQYFMSCDRLHPMLPLPYTWLIGLMENSPVVP